jgi:hypothetical protein
VEVLTQGLKDILGKYPSIKTNYCLEHGDKELELFCDTCDEFLCFKCAHEGARHYQHDYWVVRVRLELLGVRLSACLLKELPGQEKRTVYLNSVLKDYNTYVKGCQNRIVSALGGRNSASMKTVSMECEDRLNTLPQRLKELLSKPDPFTTFAVGPGLTQAVIGEKTFFRVYVSNMEGNVCGESNVCIGFHPKSSHSKRMCSLESSNDNPNYKLFRYQPTSIGEHELDIKVSGVHIRGSPFTVLVKDLKLKGGNGLAFAKDGTMVASEVSGHCVSLLNAGGQKVKSFGKFGRREGQFRSPCGVAVDRVGNILVADSENHRIQKFSPEGKFIKSVGSRGGRHLQFNFPRDIAVSSFNQLVYVVDKNQRVQKLTPDLTYAGKFGSHGFSDGKFNYPSGVACNRLGDVFVADIGSATLGSCRIQAFSAKGSFLRRFGGDIQVKPKGIIFLAIDCRDFVYVGIGRGVAIFTTEGEYLTSLSIPDSYGLAISDKPLYVCHFDRLQPYSFTIPKPSPPPPPTPWVGPKSIYILAIGVFIICVIVIHHLGSRSQCSSFV